MKTCILLQVDIMIVLNGLATLFEDLFGSSYTFLSLFFGS